MSQLHMLIRTRVVSHE